MVIPATRHWLSEGEKYSIVALQLKLAGQLPHRLTRDLWALTGEPFRVPPHWKEWLGSIRTKALEECNVFLLSKLASSTPGILDAENKLLQQRVYNFYVGLMLASPFTPMHSPVILSGECENDEISIRQHQELDTPILSVINLYREVTAQDFQRAAELGQKLLDLPSARVAGGHWRLLRTLSIYIDARTTAETIDRIHQYCRAIDGLICSQPGRGRTQFATRTDLFVGIGHKERMSELYDIRSAVEHLHEYRYLEKFDRDVRLDLIQKEAVAEYIVRTALGRIITEPVLWPHFSNTSALENFWQLPGSERRQLWGPPVDPLAALENYDPRYISDGELGAPAANP